MPTLRTWQCAECGVPGTDLSAPLRELGLARVRPALLVAAHESRHVEKRRVRAYGRIAARKRALQKMYELTRTIEPNTET